MISLQLCISDRYTVQYTESQYTKIQINIHLNSDSKINVQQFLILSK